MQLLDKLRQRFGNLLVGFWITISLFAVICLTAVYLVHLLIFSPLIGRLPYSATSDQILHAVLPWNLGFALFTVAIAAALIRFSLIEPLLRRRRELEADLASAPAAEQVHALAEQRAKLTGQLDAALEDNLALRDGLEQERAQLQVGQQRLASVISTANEPLMLLDAQGELLCLSQSMLSLLRVRQQDVFSTPMSMLIRAFDAGKDSPREYPLPELVSNALSQASAIPKLQDVVLLDQSDCEHRVMFSTQAILDDGGVSLGLLLRVQSEEEGGKALSGSLERGQDEKVALEQRLEELLHSARRQDVEHCLSFMSIDNGLEIYQQHGLNAAGELFWSVGQMLREEFGSSVELFRVDSFFYAIVLPFQAPEQCQDSHENLRSAVEARDFCWKKAQYRASLSAVLSPLDSQTQSVALLLEDSDKALRQARELGGNRIVINTTDEVNVQARAIDEQLVEWLKLDGADTRLHLQSLELRSAPDIGVKPQILALNKVEMEDGFWADPAAFLASAARVNLLPEVDRWSLRETLQACQRHPELEESHGSILLPIHMQSVMAKGFLQDVQDLMLDSGVAPQRLRLGLSEQDCASLGSQVSAFIQACREMGMEFAVLGCRLSSMQAAVASLRPSLISLHRSLYEADVANDAAAASALRYIVSCAQEQVMQVAVTEALEPNRAAALRDLGVHLVAEASPGLGPLY